MIYFNYVSLYLSSMHPSHMDIWFYYLLEIDRIVDHHYQWILNCALNLSPLTSILLGQASLTLHLMNWLVPSFIIYIVIFRYFSGFFREKREWITSTRDPRPTKLHFRHVLISLVLTWSCHTRWHHGYSLNLF